MEETQNQTYAYETNPDSEQLLKIKKEELKVLKKKADRDRIIRLADSAQKRVIRDGKIDRINFILKNIKEQMVYYNRAGKIEKSGIDILGNIKSLIDNDIDIESEAVDESEISPPGN